MQCSRVHRACERNCSQVGRECAVTRSLPDKPPPCSGIFPNRVRNDRSLTSGKLSGQIAATTVSRFHSFGFFSLFCGLAYWATLQTMDELFPERPALLLDFMLPSRAEYLLLNLWVANPHVTTPGLLAWKTKNGVLNESGVPRLCSLGDKCCNQTLALVEAFCARAAPGIKPPRENVQE